MQRTGLLEQSGCQSRACIHDARSNDRALGRPKLRLRNWRLMTYWNYLEEVPMICRSLSGTRQFVMAKTVEPAVYGPTTNGLPGTSVSAPVLASMA